MIGKLPCQWTHTWGILRRWWWSIDFEMHINLYHGKLNMLCFNNSQEALKVSLGQYVVKINTNKSWEYLQLPFTSPIYSNLNFSFCSTSSAATTPPLLLKFPIILFEIFSNWHNLLHISASYLIFPLPRTYIYRHKDKSRILR